MVATSISTAISPQPGTSGEKQFQDSRVTARGVSDNASTAPPSPRTSEELKPVYDNTRRKLKPRHIQLIGIGGLVPKSLSTQENNGD